MAREARAPARGRHWGVCFRASRFSTTAKRKKKKEKRQDTLEQETGGHPFKQLHPLR